MTDVLRIIARLNVGGPARHVLRIDAPLRRRGWDTLLVTGRAEAREGELLDEARELGIRLVVLEDLGRAIHPLRDLRVLRRLRALVAEHRPAIVHTHTAKAGLLGRLAVGGGALSTGGYVPRGGADLPRRTGRPALVHTYHGHVLSGHFRAPVAAAFRQAERALAPRTQRLVAVAAQVRDELLSVHGVGRAEQYAIVPPGIDGPRTAPDRRAGAALRAALGWAPGQVVVGCVGRLAPVKRVERLLDAWPAVAAAAPDARLLVVGDGPCGDDVRGRLAALPGAAWLPPRTDLRAVYGALDALVLCSAHEGLPQVLVEALAAGLPVVATAVGGVPSLLAHGRQGLLVPPGDAGALVAALSAVCRNGALRARLAAGARAADLASHGVQAVADALAALYAELAPARLDRAAAETQTRAACTSSS
ncbi:MAG TPA: glycosyltransferase [Planctomycetota bacterium]|nr:glycosyltransferase [Planctomycetota bacterium]